MTVRGEEFGKYKYLVASDLDGTLLLADGSVSPENKRAIKEMKERGICFVPCSGRTFSEMPRCVLDDPNIRYYIGSDGGAIWDKQMGSLTEIAMSRREVRPVLDMLDEYKTLNTVRSGGRCAVDPEKYGDKAFAEHRLSYLYGEFIKEFDEKKENFSEYVRSLEGIEMMCVFFADDNEMEECAGRIEALGGFSVASSEITNIEIFSSRAGKGNTLLRLADMLGIPHERTIAVGDSRNDMDMIKKAGISLAMENASDEVKAAAHRTICHYRDHSAKYILENIII